MADFIKPRVLKGFRDSLPETEIFRRKLIKILEKNFQSYGYSPIDTPVLEYAEILLSKGGGETERQSYRFTDHGGRNVALRFDLTVPFARFIASHINALSMPFRRYHIGKAWRGENTQKGRYREFIQCDFDIVGSDSAAADLEIMIMMSSALPALGIDSFRIHFSHRGLFNRFLDAIGIQDKTTDVLRIIDKRDKIGPDEIQQLLKNMVGEQKTEHLLHYTSAEKNNRDTLEKMLRLAGAWNDSEHIRMNSILDTMEQLAIEEKFYLNPSITRGLDYYTGIVFETFLNDLPGWGSVCSGGRYDNLTGLFMKDPLSGVGASIGLDRLMAAMEELGQYDKRSSHTDILILMLDNTLLGMYQGFARDLRHQGLCCEVFPEAKKITAQFKYAEARDIPLALIVGSDEVEKDVVNLKDLRQKTSYNALSFSAAGKKIKEILGVYSD